MSEAETIKPMIAQELLGPISRRVGDFLCQNRVARQTHLQDFFPLRDSFNDEAVAIHFKGNVQVCISFSTIENSKIKDSKIFAPLQKNGKCFGDGHYLTITTSWSHEGQLQEATEWIELRKKRNGRISRSRRLMERYRSVAISRVTQTLECLKMIKRLEDEKGKFIEENKVTFSASNKYAHRDGVLPMMVATSRQDGRIREMVFHTVQKTDHRTRVKMHQVKSIYRDERLVSVLCGTTKKFLNIPVGPVKRHNLVVLKRRKNILGHFRPNEHKVAPTPKKVTKTSQMALTLSAVEMTKKKGHHRAKRELRKALSNGVTAGVPVQTQTTLSF